MVDPGKYFLVQQASNAAVGASLPTPDHAIPRRSTWRPARARSCSSPGRRRSAATAGRRRAMRRSLRESSTSSATATPTSSRARAAGTLSNTAAAIRAAENVDTDNNSVDFDVRTPRRGTESSYRLLRPSRNRSTSCKAKRKHPHLRAWTCRRPGIVTARKTNGFFLQMPDIEGDGDPDTSDALFVFTGSAPAAAVGDEVRVVGRLVEFRSSSAVTPGTLTEITGPAVTILSSGNPLPAALDLAALLAPPASFSSRVRAVRAVRERCW